MAGHLPGPNASAGVLAAVWIGLAGCGSEPVGPTPPAEVPAPSAAAPRQPTLVAAAAPLGPSAASRETSGTLDFNDEIADLRARFLPNLKPQARTAMADALDELAALTAGDDRAGVATALTRAALALREGDGSPSDLDALRRTLDAMRAALGPATTDPLTRSGGTDDPRTR
ncbi:MAG TPA: hypothetical protein VJQ44_15765 [Gemmatimonadales bacterium]|nr:hypothetical protein [Gemmatimonadales bacterium]